MRHPFVTEILKRVAPKIGAKLIIEPEYQFAGRIVFQNGTSTFYNNTSFNINSIGSVGIAKDKSYAAFFLAEMNYNVPEGNTFFNDKINSNIKLKRTIDDGFQYAIKLGFPVVIKPNDRSQGYDVYKVFNKKEYYKFAKKIFSNSGVMLIQRFYEGSDYRVVVLDDSIISAYLRIPLFIIGDGKSTIEELLQLKQLRFEKEGRDTVIDIKDKRINYNLFRQKLNITSVLEIDHKVFLLDNANLSSGGTAIDVTETIHDTFKKLAVSITKHMGLRLCGVDFITSDISLPMKDYIVLEINGAPGLDNYGSIGVEQQNRVDELYFQILQALQKGK